MHEAPSLSGPLLGLKIVEFAGLGPTPFTAMLMADMGAEVVRIERPGASQLIPQDADFLNRGRGFVQLDLKRPQDREQTIELIKNADALIEGMRPGVMERLGLGPDQFEETNPKLVYGRMTGWGQEGPLAQSSGHDINYIALTGALHSIGGNETPVPPLNLLGDFGGGALYLAFGMVCALLEAQTSGKGQVVDAAIVDGTAHLMTMIYSLHKAGIWQDSRNTNLLDGAAPFYTTYLCSDGKHVAVGALEPQFYATLLYLLDLDETKLPPQHSRSGWPELRTTFTERFAQKSQAEWRKIFDGTDACVAPVLTLQEAPGHAHNLARNTFEDIAGSIQPAAAPRFSRTPGKAQPGLEASALSISEILARWQAK
ncbi:MAG: CoA transferase [Rhodobacteraceae bacterium]|nr:CoA transferase [Paracoccaceae bacterium]